MVSTASNLTSWIPHTESHSNASDLTMNGDVSLIFDIGVLRKHGNVNSGITMS